MDRRGFIKTGLASLGAGASLGSSTVAKSEEKKLFRNWAGNITQDIKTLATPTSQKALQQAIQNAQKIKLMGSRHSFSACAAPVETLVNTDRLNKILDFDLGQKLVKVEAGIKLYDLNEWLYQHGMCLPSIGDIDRQSLAGVISTGTHGTGLKWGSFSDESLIRGMEVVLADGSLLELEAGRDDELLSAFRLSMGALGAIYSVTLQLEAAHNLEVTTMPLSLNEAMDPQHYLDHDHYEFFMLPFTQKVQAIFRNRTDKPQQHYRRKFWLNDILMENLLLGLIMRASSLRPAGMRRVMAFMAKLMTKDSMVARSDLAMATSRLVKFYETEYAMPLESFEAGIEAYHEVNERMAKAKPGERFFANFPAEVRFIRGDQGNLLSPTGGKDSFYLATQSHVAFGQGYQRYFRAMEREFLKLGGRPHWGKLFYANPLHLYEKMPRFLALRAELDPKGVFLNSYLEDLIQGELMHL